MTMTFLSLSATQLLLAFVAASVLHKLTYHRFFLRWLTSCKFTCYLSPTNDVLRNLRVRQPKNVNKLSKSRKDFGDTWRESFSIHTSELSKLHLEKTEIKLQDFERLNYSYDLEWVVDLSLVSTFSFFITDLQFYFYPSSNEWNFSLLWALIVIIYSLKILTKLGAIYFTNKESSGERSICIISGCLFFVVAMIALMNGGTFLEVGLDYNYQGSNASSHENNSIQPDRSHTRRSITPGSIFVVKIGLALLGAFLGVVLTFPGLRFGQLHKALLERPETSTLLYAVYSTSYLIPLVIVCLWVKPISNLLRNSEIFDLADENIVSMRIYLIIFGSMLRLFLFSRYLRIFLDSVKNRVARLRYHGGNVTNRELQVLVSGYYNYIMVIAVQFILPTMMCMFTALILKATGGYFYTPWTHDITEDVSSSYADIYRGLVGFATWWFHLTLYLTNTAGVVYHTFFIY